MFEFERIVEQRIVGAINRGELDNLPGQGKPLELDDDSFVSPEMRLAYRILKNAGFVPEEISLRRQIFDLESALDDAPDEAHRVHAMKRLDILRARLAAGRGYETACHMQERYQRKLVARFSNRRKDGSGRSAPGDG